MTQNNGMCEGQLLFALLILQNTVQPQTWSFSCGSGTLTETEGRLAVQQTCFQLIKPKKHQEAHRKAFVNKITINNASGKFSTYSHSLIALNSCKAEALTFQMQTDCLEGRTQKNLVLAASPGQRCAIVQQFSFSKNAYF